ncbi:MAG: tetratricopeptide repeat protein, partial [Bryobacteraceae bacterium]
LGVVATRAGHFQRSREVLEAALRQQPQNADVLYSLAFALESLGQREDAARHLAQAVALAPRRADIRKLLAITMMGLSAFEDAIGAWDRYLDLEPGDDNARRERAFAAVLTGRVREGIAGLEQYLQRHPQDPAGHYQLGIARSEDEPERGLDHLDKAIALRPGYAAARSARGAIRYQQGKPEAALADLEFAGRERPGDAAALDRLGQAYSALDRSAEAVRVLRQAAALAPGDSRIQLHFGRALADAGETEESKVVLERFRRLGPVRETAVPAGLVEYLALAPEKRRADYRARVEKALRESPDDDATLLRYLKLLLEDGPATEVEPVARRIKGPRAEARRALLEAGRHALARELLDAVPEVERGGEDRLVRARLLLAYGGATPEALRLLDEAARLLPADRDVALLGAAAREVAGQSQADMLVRLRKRWPEWHAVWLAQGVILANRGAFDEARPMIETAIALGARSPEARAYLDSCARRSAPDVAVMKRLFLVKPARDW